MSSTKDYPNWICWDCGSKYGSWYQGDTYTGPKYHCSTNHYGTCDVCKRKGISVTEPRDYGHLVKGWDNKETDV
jgi:hypothetical protein